MKIRTRITDRQALVDFLRQYTGEKPSYLGAPGFQYVVGPYTVLRNADIQTDDASAKQILGTLQELGYVEETEAEGVPVSIGTDDVRARMNLLNMISSRGKLISKAIGNPNVLSVTQAFLKQMQERNPEDTAAFDEALALCQAGKGLRGLKFYDDKVIFTCFKTDETDEAKAQMELAKAMVHAAESQRWVKPEPEPTENEKYTFRVWLTSIGLKGRKYSDARTVLLYNLEGNGTYRTEEQYQAAMAKLAAARKERRAENHADFTVL